MTQVKRHNQGFLMGILGFFLMISRPATATIRNVQVSECPTAQYCLQFTSEQADISQFGSAWALKSGEFTLFDEKVISQRISFKSGYWRPDENLLRLTSEDKEWLIYTDHPRVVSEMIQN